MCVVPDNNFRNEMTVNLDTCHACSPTYVKFERQGHGSKLGLQSQLDSYTCGEITYAYRIRVRFGHQTAHVVARLSLKHPLPVATMATDNGGNSRECCTFPRIVTLSVF